MANVNRNEIFDDTFEIGRLNKIHGISRPWWKDFIGSPVTEYGVFYEFNYKLFYYFLGGFILYPIKNVLKWVFEFSLRMGEAWCKATGDEANSLRHTFRGALWYGVGYAFQGLKILVRTLTSPLTSLERALDCRSDLSESYNKIIGNLVGGLLILGSIACTSALGMVCLFFPPLIVGVLAELFNVFLAYMLGGLVYYGFALGKAIAIEYCYVNNGLVVPVPGDQITRKQIEYQIRHRNNQHFQHDGEDLLQQTAPPPNDFIPFSGLAYTLAETATPAPPAVPPRRQSLQSNSGLFGEQSRTLAEVTESKQEDHPVNCSAHKPPNSSIR